MLHSRTKLPTMENTIWWRDYRRRRYKKCNHLSFEMNLRKSVVDTAKDYLKNCSVPGVQHICKPGATLKYRLFWVAVISLSFVMVCHYSVTFIFSSNAKPLTIKVRSSTYPIREIDFPAVALCNVNRISNKALQKRVKDTFLDFKGIVNLTEIKHFYLDIEKLINFRYVKDPVYIKSFNVLNSWMKRKVNITDLMEEMAPSCEEMIIKCLWAGSVDCKDMFHTRRTARGHCCVFNYVLNYNSGDKPSVSAEPIKRQTVPSPEFGLNVIIDPQLYDYTSSVDLRTGFDVYMFDPVHFLDPTSGRVIQVFGQVNQGSIFLIESTKQTASSGIRIYSPKTRRCRFQDELGSDFDNMYSYSACLTKCRIQSIHSLCKCIPFFMPSAIYKNNRICSLRDLICLNKHKEKFLYLYPHETTNTYGLEIEKSDSLSCPFCLPDCELTRHSKQGFIVTLNKINQDKEFRYHFLNNVNLTDKCYISIYQSDTTGVWHNLELVTQWYELLANFGGFAGMLMGLGVFTVIEITYFVFIRMVQIFMFNYKINNYAFLFF